MTEHVILALIVTVAPTLAAIAALITSLKNREAIRALHCDVDGRLQMLLDNAHQAGVLQGRNEHR